MKILVVGIIGYFVITFLVYVIVTLGMDNAELAAKILAGPVMWLIITIDILWSHRTRHYRINYFQQTQPPAPYRETLIKSTFVKGYPYVKKYLEEPGPNVVARVEKLSAKEWRKQRKVYHL